MRFGGLTALDDVTFSVRPGEVVALIGPNGAGKTTVFNAICNLLRYDGRIRIDGAPIPRGTSRLGRHGVARTLQGLGLFPSMTALENVLVPIASGPNARAAALAQLTELDLGRVAARRVAELSYPDRKRVALARALVTDPSLMLLDEPAGGLGSDDIAALTSTIREIAQSGRSVLLVEHHVDFVMGLADRIFVLDFGRLIAAGTPAEVRANPKVEEAYLGVPAGSEPWEATGNTARATLGASS
ncbi:ABC transporter ATP-binding protein [Leucobacter komagatae]